MSISSIIDIVFRIVIVVGLGAYFLYFNNLVGRLEEKIEALISNDEYNYNQIEAILSMIEQQRQEMVDYEDMIEPLDEEKCDKE